MTKCINAYKSANSLLIKRDFPQVKSFRNRYFGQEFSTYYWWIINRRSKENIDNQGREWDETIKHINSVCIQ